MPQGDIERVGSHGLYSYSCTQWVHRWAHDWIWLPQLIELHTHMLTHIHTVVSIITVHSPNSGLLELWRKGHLSIPSPSPSPCFFRVSEEGESPSTSGPDGVVCSFSIPGISSLEEWSWWSSHTRSSQSAVPPSATMDSLLSCELVPLACETSSRYSKLCYTNTDQPMLPPMLLA